MKHQKIKEIKKVASEAEADDYVRSLATGKFYKNGIEITQTEFEKTATKVKIDLGPGIKPEEP